VENTEKRTGKRGKEDGRGGQRGGERGEKKKKEKYIRLKPTERLTFDADSLLFATRLNRIKIKLRKINKKIKSRMKKHEII